ncbi:MAG: hypothetical protein JXR97_09425 [Planctomycetes bacterium]|nr:hypothetical protein [Planctomycetota bacterium]
MNKIILIIQSLIITVLAITPICSGLEFNTRKPPLMKDLICLRYNDIGISDEAKAKAAVKLFKPLCSHIRTKHSFPNDLYVSSNLSKPLSSKEGNNTWLKYYRVWHENGFKTGAELDLSSNTVDILLNNGAAFWYGEEFARTYGPSGKHKSVDSIDFVFSNTLRNSLYLELFSNLSKGIRKGDPKLKILTNPVHCFDTNTKKAPKHPVSADDYKSINLYWKIPDLYDIINVKFEYYDFHGKPLEDKIFNPKEINSRVANLKQIIRWRDEFAKDKEIWVTKFGWHTERKKDIKADKGKDDGIPRVSQEQQAQFLVRTLLVFSSLGIDRAYIHHNDDSTVINKWDTCGITDGSSPKASYYAIAHLCKTLGNYRFKRILKAKENSYMAYEYIHGEDPEKLIWVVWCPLDDYKKKKKVTLSTEGGYRVLRAEKMPMEDLGNPDELNIKLEKTRVTVSASTTPVYIFMEKSNLEAEGKDANNPN